MPTKRIAVKPTDSYPVRIQYIDHDSKNKTIKQHRFGNESKRQSNKSSKNRKTTVVKSYAYIVKTRVEESESSSDYEPPKNCREESSDSSLSFDDFDDPPKKKSPVKRKSTKTVNSIKKKPKTPMTYYRFKARPFNPDLYDTNPSPSITPNEKQTVKSEEIIEKPPLCDAVLECVKRLGGVLPTLPLKPRVYRAPRYEIPTPIQYFADIRWPKGVKFMNKEFDVYDLEFAEYDLRLEEWEEFAFLRNRQKAYLFGDGNVMLCTLLDGEHLDNFDVYILDDDFKNDAEGPFLLSDFLCHCTVDDGVRPLSQQRSSQHRMSQTEKKTS